MRGKPFVDKRFSLPRAPSLPKTFGWWGGGAG